MPLKVEERENRCWMIIEQHHADADREHESSIKSIDSMTSVNPTL